MKYELVLSSSFKKSIKTAKKRGLDITLLDTVVSQLLQGDYARRKISRSSTKRRLERIQRVSHSAGLAADIPD